MNYQRIKPAKLADVIVEQLEAMILEGNLPPGERLPAERELAKQFDVSRPSLREAIQQLEVKGLVFRRQGGGTYVQHNLREGLTDPLFNLLLNDPQSQLDLLEFRHAFEGVAAYYAALRGTQSDLDKLQTCYHEVEKVQGEPEETDAVLAFYEAITEASHNLVLVHMIRGIKPLLQQNIQQNLGLLNSQPKVVEKIGRHRQLLLQAIMQGQPDAARDACHQHLNFIETTLLEHGRTESRLKK